MALHDEILQDIDHNKILTNLADVETTLQKVLEDHIDGKYGYITREWGFFAPGGLGGKLGGKFEPWEKKLEQVKSFFWPIEAYEAMEKRPFGKPDPEEVKNLPPEGEKLAGNTPLHYFLMEAPEIEVVLEPSDYDDYKSAARIFLLLATLSHLCGNSALDPKTAELPSWIEVPLIDVANRLDIEPTLTGHFVVQENWMWNTANEGPKMPTFSTRQSRRTDRVILKTLLSKCEVEDRRYRFKVYHNCFLGSQLVDVLMDSDFNLSSRMEAVRLARRINNKYNLFYHVTGDHPLMDKYLFYRFRKKWRSKITESQMMAEDSEDQELASSDSEGNNADTDDELQNESTSRMVRPLEFLSRSTSTASGNVLSESARLEMMDSSVPQAPLSRHRSNSSNGNFSFRRRKNNFSARELSDRERSHTVSNGSSTNEFMAAIAVMAKVPVKDRRYHFKVYKQCFIAKELVDLLMVNECASTRKEAVLLVQNINKRFELLAHVVHDHEFKDEYLFFRFTTVFQTMLDVQSDTIEDLSQSLAALTPAESRKMSLADEAAQILPLSRHKSGGSDSGDSMISSGSSIDISSSGGYNRPKRGASMVAVPDVQDSQRENGNEQSSSEDFMTVIAIMRRVPLKDRRHRFKVYKQSFVGKELVDLLMANECAKTRKEAVTLLRRINGQFELFAHVVAEHDFKDEYLFYQFNPVFQNFLEEPSDAISDSSNPFSTVASSAEKTRRLSFQEGVQRSGSGSEGGSSFMGSITSHDGNLLATESRNEFRLDSIKMLYPAFGNNHERVNQLVPACMGYSLRSLPYLILDVLAAMYAALETKLQDDDNEEAGFDQSFEALHLADLLHDLASCVSRCKEQFQLMSTDPTKRGFNSKHVSIRQTQPLSNGVLVRRTKGGKPMPAKGVTGTQFPYFHLLDWLLGRHQLGGKVDSGLVAKIASVDDTYPRPQREYIRALGNLEKASTLRGFLDALGRPPRLLAAYNHLIECYAGEGGLLQAHSRKLYSYIHNDVQFSTSGTRHLSSKEEGKAAQEPSRAQDNHLFATTMFKHMRNAAEERWRLRIPPLMTEVEKMVYSTSESGGYTTVALCVRGTGLVYEYGDVVKVLLPNDDKTAFAWALSFAKEEERSFKLDDMQMLYKDTGNGWGWKQLWEALGWQKYEKDGGAGVPFDLIARYIEQAQILEDGKTSRWINSPLDLVSKKNRKLFPVPPKIEISQVLSLEPVSPRVYSVSGVETDRVFLLVSKPQDGARHHGYERMSDSSATTVHCSFSPATAFLVPPKKSNLVCIASGTGISPFVGLSDAIGMRHGTTTIVHQCKSSELFLCNSQHWLDFTAVNPGACVLGYISGDRSRRNCPMRYMIQNGAFEETTLLGRKSAAAYYFECPVLKTRVKETYVNGGVNLAYCCGGVKSAIEPFRGFVTNEGMNFEFTVECYGVSSTLTDKSTAAQIGGTVVNMDNVSPIHPGGDQILHQIQDIGTEKLEQANHGCVRSGAVPDHSIAFWECHPHAYNLHRCLRAPLDADSEAFSSFLERQAMSQGVMVTMATKYAEVALASPNDSKVVRVATELQASALRQQLQSGDSEGAMKSANYLETLLEYVSSKDDDAFRWTQLLQEYKDSVSEEVN